MAEYLDFEPATSFPHPGPKTAHLVLYPVLISEDAWPFSGLTHSLFVKSLKPCPKRSPTPGFEMHCVAPSSLRAHTQGCGLRVTDTDPAWPPTASLRSSTAGGRHHPRKVLSGLPEIFPAKEAEYASPTFLTLPHLALSWR